jgi:hypothetical protein
MEASMLSAWMHASLRSLAPDTVVGSKTLMNSRIGLAALLVDRLGSLWATMRMGLSLPWSDVAGSPDEPGDSEPEFQGWLRGAPFVTEDPASSHRQHRRGYITGNGLGSLEIGHSDD